MAFTKLAPIDPIVHCLNCPPRPQTIPLDALVHPGFGGASVHAEDEPDLGQAMYENATVQDVEDFACGEEHDWRMTINAPLYDAEYQRQGKGVWVLVRRGEGFA